MKNVYQDSEMLYSEIATTLKNYTYGSNCRFSIPSLTALVSNGEDEITKKNQVSNISNRDVQLLGIDTYTSCNHVVLHIPFNLCPTCATLKEYCTHQGNKGDKFILTFLEGDINKCRIVGRY